MTAASPVYRSIMLEIERRRIALGWPMEKFSEFAGVPDRYYAKALFSDAPGGRQAQWRTLQLIIDALFPAGFDIEIKARAGAVMTKDNLKAQLLQLRATVDPRSQRQLMSDLGKRGAKKGGHARWKNVNASARARIARKAAIIRWDQVKAAVAKPSASRASDTSPAAAPPLPAPVNPRKPGAGPAEAKGQGARRCLSPTA